MKRLDLIIIVVVIAISLAFIGILNIKSSENFTEKYVEINVDGELFKTIPLNDPTYKEIITIKTSLGTNIVKIENGKVSIIDADCPDKLCVMDGPIENPGEILVCLPNKVAVEIKGKKVSDIDQISY